MGKREFLRRHLLVSAGIAFGFTLLIGILGYGLFLDPTRVPAANLGKPAMPIRVGVVQGSEGLDIVDQKLTLEKFHGKPIILNFWASWCVSCREEARELEAFWKKHHSEVWVLGIAVQDQEEDAKRFAAQFGKTYPIGIDEDGRAAIDYGVSGVPETFLISRDGRIVHKEVGPVAAAQLESFLPKILN